MWNKRFWIALLFAWVGSLMSLSGCASANSNLGVTGQPNSKEWVSRGAVFLKAKQFREAIEAYSNAIELDPQNEAAYCKRGIACASLGEYERAIENYDKAIELSPDYAEAYCARGLAFLALGDKKRGGLKDIQTAARLGNYGAQTILKSVGASW